MLIQRAFCQSDLRVNAKNKAEHITTKPKAERVPPADRKFLSIHMIRDDNGAIPAMVNTFMPITRAMKSGDVFSCNSVRKRNASNSTIWYERSIFVLFVKTHRRSLEIENTRGWLPSQ